MHYNRRTFLKNFALGGGALAFSHLIFADKAKASERPLEMLALGDSVMWGQGLKPENKFTYIIQTWLESKTGRKVNFHREAHSGAKIFPEIDKGKAFHGEINFPSPSIFQQITNSLEYYKNRKDSDGGKLVPEAVDLIFVNGGINDMGALNIFFSTENKISGKAKKYCYDGMSKLLTKIVHTYPNAKIVVPGYFPLISGLSSPTEVLDVVLTVVKENKIQTFLSKLAKKILEKTPDKFHLIHNALTNNSNTWYAESNNRLKQAVEEINSKNKNLLFFGTNPQILFVEVPFKPENCYAVDETTFLWRLESQIAANDEVFEERKQVCKVFKNNSIKEIICSRAGAFHPNVKGAKAYARVIEDKLQEVSENTIWKI